MGRLYGDRTVVLSDEDIRLGLEQFAETDATAQEIPLLQEIAHRACGDARIVALMRQVQRGQPWPLLLLGAARYVRLREVCGDRSCCEAMLREAVCDFDDYEAFRQVCLTHADEIALMIRTRRVQTNEVGRTAVLFAALGYIIKDFCANRHLCWLDVGASAGLSTLVGEYRFSLGRLYQDERNGGVGVSCQTAIGGHEEAKDWGRPMVGMALGIDVGPLNVCDEDAARWLLSLVPWCMESRVRTLCECILEARQRTVVVL